MTIQAHLQEFAGKPVVDWDAESGIQDPQETLPRISLDYDEYEQDKSWLDKFAIFLEDPNAAQMTGLVVGSWDFESSEDSSGIVEALVVARDRLPNLTAIFLGDILSEENEISWIRQSDVSPLFDAYPALEYFGVRGGEGLSLGALRHDRLRSLIIQTGGLDGAIVRAVAGAHLPHLEHLELWLGTEDYGGSVTVEDLQPILAGDVFPKLHYLGLRDSQIADEVAQALATAPIVERIRVLDLSMGALGDDGAHALMENPAVAKLEKLDIHYHFCSDEIIEKLRSSLPGVEVDASDPQKPHEWNGHSDRYVAVSE